MSNSQTNHLNVLTAAEEREVLRSTYLKADRLMAYFIYGYFVMGVLLALYYDTYLMAFGVGGLCVATFWVVNRLLPGTQFARYVTSGLFSVYVAQFIYQMHGLFEMHFMFFVMCTIMIIYQDWKVMVPGTLVIVVHHTLFATLQNLGYEQVYFSQLDYIGLSTLAFHYGIVVMQVAVCGVWAYLLRERTLADARHLKTVSELNRDVIAQQQEIAKANQELQAKSDALQEALEESIAQEEEIRQNAEELTVTNEYLVQTRQDLLQALDELRATQNQLVTNEKMASLGQLVAGVAHEINTPLGVSVTAASHLAKETQAIVSGITAGSITKNDMARYFKTAGESSTVILKNLERAAQLVDSFKKVAVNQSQDEILEFDLRSCIEETLISLSPQFKNSRIQYEIQAPEKLMIRSYPSAFSQILINFVTNALRYAFAPDQTGTLTIRAAQENDRLVFTFSDNGAGMPPEVREKVFDPFFTTGRSIGGSGLGMNIVYNLVTQKLKGSIECQSQPGAGTTFILNLPPVVVEQPILQARVLSVVHA
jgi:signal transduction histidine kinase